MIGFSLLEIVKSNNLADANLFYYFYPQKPSYKLEIDLLDWANKRIIPIQKELGSYVKLRTYSRNDQLNKNNFLKQNGFTVDRYFLTMAISFNQSLPNPLFCDEFKLSSMAKIPDKKSWVEMYNQSFIDHWNYHQLDIDTLNNWFTHPNYQPELNLIAIAPNQIFAAFC